MRATTHSGHDAQAARTCWSECALLLVFHHFWFLPRVINLEKFLLEYQFSTERDDQTIVIETCLLDLSYLRNGRPG